MKLIGVFVRVYGPSTDDLRQLNDPHIIAMELQKNPNSKTLDFNNGTLVVELSWDDEGEFLIVHRKIRAIYEKGTLVRVSKSIVHELNYDPSKSNVLVDYVNTYTTYKIEETYCWQVFISWCKFALKEYLKHKLREIPYPKPWDREPW
ncbi:hypothetical protein E3E35_06030 [Thermococcus sp. GR7]|uniref:hypothetical protein n=1 Tax=unclassified Thermococcus TaxID=2627626 RepID=UPI0014318FCF|nr:MULTISPECIES: hypothetical protein [unclassified Thermococcus]NJE46970.1 hypothetical protein [Thermococcus sp. GR7]NJE78978.1 hypothetical protein [Thermococcus sp. GR4]NJF22678.1 hypothetical protein [Thermococcus sp. GR5]